MTTPSFWQVAEARNQIWRTFLGFVLIMLIWVLITFAISIGGGLFLRLSPVEATSGTSQLGAMLLFLTFIGFHIGLVVVLPILHRRSYLSLFGPIKRLNLRHFRLGLLATLAIFVAMNFLSLIEPLFLPKGMTTPVTQAQSLQSWAIGLGPALLLIFMQSFGEELVFRGYLLQQLHARFRSPLIWAVLPALIFGALHFSPVTYGMVNAVVTVANATLMGTLAAFITVRTGNIAAAAGLHFGNNAAMVLVGQADYLSGFSLFTAEMDPQSLYTTYSVIMQSTVVLVIFIVWWRWMAHHRPIANTVGAA